MKKRILQALFVAAVTIFTTTTVHAQEKGEMAIGGGLSVSTGDDHTNVGIGAKFQWNPINNLRLEPSFNYFFKDDHWSFWDLSANLHYLFPVNRNVTLYPLAGIGILNLDVDFGHNSMSDTQFAFNLGGGVDVALSSEWYLNFEFKYKIADTTNRAVFSFGFGYKF